MQTEQRHSKYSDYVYRDSDDKPMKTNPVKYTGMIWTAFRPSDDPCRYNYLIPAEMQAVTALNAMAQIDDIIDLSDRAREARKLRDEVHAGIEKYGKVKIKNSESKDPRWVYAYEVDGFGNAKETIDLRTGQPKHYNLMDDANMPSLLGIPSIGYLPLNNETYQNTRQFVLSKNNPYYYNPKHIGVAGIGSPHTPDGYIWPLAKIIEIQTANTHDQQTQGLLTLLRSDPGDHLLHESFSPEHPQKNYTRKDFGWPNALMIALVEQLSEKLATPHVPTDKIGRLKRNRLELGH